MPGILEFIRSENAFDLEVVALLVEAYDSALKSLHDRGQPEIVREIIAERIIEAAKKGERNPDRLCEAGLVAMRRPDTVVLQLPRRGKATVSRG
jgi:hypothetical protein